MEQYEGLDLMTVTGTEELEAWLADHHADRAGVWLRIAKKGGGGVSLTNPEILDCMLCFGWIDGQRKSGDDTYYLQKYTAICDASPQAGQLPQDGALSCENDPTYRR
ncbi:hypothetical protein MIU24_19165 [Streptomyces venezuelae]|uniref:YdeI/OmpD-associated family protein n=1 Tax=Streptomyces sp. B6(2022) TaxID=3404749 RepID=UPI00311DCBE1